MLGPADRGSEGLCPSPAVLDRRPIAAQHDKATCTEAFPVGMVKNSKYTTMQLNRNCTAKMHADGNNHGPSYIIATSPDERGATHASDDALLRVIPGTGVYFSSEHAI